MVDMVDSSSVYGSEAKEEIVTGVQTICRIASVGFLGS